MRIAVVQHVTTSYYSEYLSSLIDEIATAEGYQIKTWSSSVPVVSQHIAANAVVYILIESSSSFSLKWWYSKRLPSIFRKLNADVVIDLNGIYSNTKIPQFILADQTIEQKKSTPKNKIKDLAAKRLQESLKNAAKVLVYSNKKSEELAQEQLLQNKLFVLPFTAPDNFRKFEWHEKIMTKAMHADNNEYFVSILNDDAEDDFTLLLRGYSKFKKWQQSGMKLILLPKYEAFEQNIHAKLKSYKHREDVSLLEGQEGTKLVEIIASAHSFIHYSSTIADIESLSIALKCALPVITFKDADTEEYLKNAAVYVNEKAAEDFGDALIQLYKDENLLAQLKQHAEEQSALLDRKKYKDALWQLMQTAAHN